MGKLINQYQKLIGDDARLTIYLTEDKVEGNTLTVTFAPNETQDGRYVRVAVSAGDIFDKIMFVQKPE